MAGPLCSIITRVLVSVQDSSCLCDCPLYLCICTAEYCRNIEVCINSSNIQQVVTIAIVPFVGMICCGVSIAWPCIQLGLIGVPSCLWLIICLLIFTGKVYFVLYDVQACPVIVHIVGYCSGNYEARRASGKKYEAQIVIFRILVAVNRFSWISRKVGKPLKKVRKPWKKVRKLLKKAESHWRKW